MSVLGKMAKVPVKLYRRFISPLLPPTCKYYPTCSAYALEALDKHGFFKGMILTVWRILRCNPLSNGGVDYVPEKVTIDYFKVRKNKVRK